MTPDQLQRASVLLAMAAGITLRERTYPPALGDEMREMAHAIQRHVGILRGQQQVARDEEREALEVARAG